MGKWKWYVGLSEGKLYCFQWPGELPNNGKVIYTTVIGPFPNHPAEHTLWGTYQNAKTA
jgi:hypothetical protein